MIAIIVGVLTFIILVRQIIYNWNKRKKEMDEYEKTLKNPLIYFL